MHDFRDKRSITSCICIQSDKLDSEYTVSRNVFSDRVSIDFSGDGIVLTPFISRALTAKLIDLHALFWSVSLDELATKVVRPEFKPAIAFFGYSIFFLIMF